MGLFQLWFSQGICPVVGLLGCIVALFLKEKKERASLVAQRLKCLPAMREMWVRSLGQEDPLEEGMATHSSIFAWRIP